MSAGEPVELVERGEDRVVERLERLSYLLDNSIRIPGTERRIGLDPLVGLLPIAGDVPTTGLSAYIVLEAAYMGVPRETVARMLVNLTLDATVGAIPLVGDVFDAVWKANARNVALLGARIDDPARANADRRFMAVLLVALVGCLLALSAATVVALAWLARTVGALF